MVAVFDSRGSTAHHAARDHGAEQEVDEPPLQFVDGSGKEHGGLGTAEAAASEQVGGVPQVGEDG